jgi:hypothetical protein
LKKEKIPFLEILFRILFVGNKFIEEYNIYKKIGTIFSFWVLKSQRNIGSYCIFNVYYMKIGAALLFFSTQCTHLEP